MRMRRKADFIKRIRHRLPGHQMAGINAMRIKTFPNILPCKNRTRPTITFAGHFYWKLIFPVRPLNLRVRRNILRKNDNIKIHCSAVSWTMARACPQPSEKTLKEPARRTQTLLHLITAGSTRDAVESRSRLTNQLETGTTAQTEPHQNAATTSRLSRSSRGELPIRVHASIRKNGFQHIL